MNMTVEQMQARIREMQTPCTWTQQEEGEWETSCGNAFVFEDGTPAENDHKFCPCCGHPLAQKLYEPETWEDK